MSNSVETGVGFSISEREMPRELAKKVTADVATAHPGSFSKKPWEDPLVNKSFILGNAADTVFTCEVSRRYLAYGVPTWVSITISDFNPEEDGFRREVLIAKHGDEEAYFCYRRAGTFTIPDMEEEETLDFLREIFQSQVRPDRSVI